MKRNAAFASRLSSGFGQEGRRLAFNELARLPLRRCHWLSRIRSFRADIKTISDATKTIAMDSAMLPTDAGTPINFERGVGKVGYDTPHELGCPVEKQGSTLVVTDLVTMPCARHSQRQPSSTQLATD